MATPTLELVPLTATIKLVAAPNNGRFPYAHSLLIQDGGANVLVDTGCGHDVLRALQAHAPIDAVICTHAHVDHINGNWLFEGRPLWLPAGIGFETAGDAVKLSERTTTDLSLRPLWLDNARQRFGLRDCPPTDAYPPDYVFEFGQTRLHTIPAPGHTLDHTCLWEPESGLLLATDIDFTGFGPWYGNPESDPVAFAESIRRVWALDPRTVISSHKGVFDEAVDIDARFEAFLAHFARREAAILAALTQPQTLDALADRAIIYGRFPRNAQLLRYFEREMVGKHLAHLAQQARVTEVEPGSWQRVV